ncbi:MAG: M23 family metallopeptidase [Roseivirga sp.]|uniref:M23 family metallopeptidase n=1 Tax=Roseivirga sp. TaxID=1964215 RepID=UPI001B12A7DF|nr:M23 family metallopeptidase [Roseivirga sp.]MBO6496007.1 M23 family metallopeptidase [Roseivirga sp.]
MRSLILLVFLSSTLFGQTSDFDMQIYVEEDNEVVKIMGNNEEYFPISLSLEVQIKGAKLAENLEEYYVLKPKSQGTILATIVKPKNANWSYKFGYNYSMGDALAEHDESYAYQLPFPAGKSYRLSQGYNGSTTHRGINALDFTMPEGASITAARAGTVVRIKEDSNRGCPSAECMHDGNYVSILHEDGTMADYVHLQKNGVIVELGEKVTVGQPIALNGATGWASRAHLHFVVYTTGNQAQKTLPVKFEISLNKVEYLKEGQTYNSFR